MPMPSYILPSAPAYTEDSVYALIPTPSTPIYTPDAISFTRGSDATRTASNGLIQRSPVNLLLQSETFENASWPKPNVNVSANTTTAPNGTLTADSLIEDSTNNLHIVSQGVSLAGGIYTASVYVKPNGRNWVFINIASASAYGAYFDIANGVVGTIQANITSATMISVGNGWYRCVITANTSATSPRIAIYTATANGTTSYQGDGTSGLFIWGAQLVEGSQPLTYFPTTDRLNVPRIDFSQGSCPALLLEPQRTNLALNSEDFTNASWAFLQSTSVTANTTTSPSGLTNADTAVINGTTPQLRQNTGAASITNGSTYTLSVYVKASASSGASNVRLTVNNTQTWTGAASTKVALTSNWQRVTLTWTSNGTQAYFIVGSTDATGAFDTTCYGNIDIWGAQLELGAYSTTYIPTTTTSVTRLADSFSKSNIYTNGLITAAGGTWYVELRKNLSLTRDAFSNGLRISDSSSTVNNGFEIRNGATIPLIITKRIAGASTTLIGTTASTTKLAIKWNGSTCDVFLDGVKQVSGSAFTATNMEFLIGSAEDVPKFIQAMALFSTPLSDAALITMTT
jgi:hypothetical protein